MNRDWKMASAGDDTPAKKSPRKVKAVRRYCGSCRSGLVMTEVENPRFPGQKVTAMRPCSCTAVTA